MHIKGRWLLYIICVFLILGICIPEQNVYAAAKQAEIVTLDDQKDLVVAFSFDKEVVDIAFISPSGKKKTVRDSDVECETGDLWSTYRIHDAEAGTWSVEYNLGKNTQIDYSIIEEDIGIWIDNFTVGNIQNGEANVSFLANCDAEQVYYDYTIYAIDSDDPAKISLVESGSENSGEQVTFNMDLTGLASGDYIFKLEVQYNNGDAEIFDSAVTDTVNFQNSNKSDTVDFKVQIDLSNLGCGIDWSEEKVWSSEKYRIRVSADGEEIYSDEYDDDTSAVECAFSEDAKKLEISLSYMSDGVWADVNTKIIELDKEYINVTNDDVTSSSQVDISYKVEKARDLIVKLSDEDEKTYKINSEGSISIDLQRGINKIYVEMETDDQVWFILDKELYYDSVPPEITLFEDIDGKTFYTDLIPIIGKVTDAKTLKISGKDVDIQPDGSFNVDCELQTGENDVDIVAEDVNGNVTQMALTLYRESTGSDTTGIVSGKINWKDYLSFIIAFISGLIVIILVLICMKKRDKTLKKKHIWPWILWDIIALGLDAVCVWQFIIRYRYSNSTQYIELVEKSAASAARYIRIERLAGLGAIIMFVIFVLSLLTTILVQRYRNKKKGNTQW